MIGWFRNTLSILVALSGFGHFAYAAPINGGFESADFSGWQLAIPQGVSRHPPRYRAVGTAGIDSFWGGQPHVLSPVTGGFFAVLGTATDAAFSGQRTYQLSLTQPLWLNQGDVLSGCSAFYNGDCIPQDSAWVRILRGDGVELASPWRESSGGMSLADPNSTPYHTATPWTRWEWKSPASGSYILSLGMTTGGDNTGASFGFFDNLCVQSPVTVPEPSVLSVSMIAAGLLASSQVKKITTTRASGGDHPVYVHPYRPY